MIQVYTFILYIIFFKINTSVQYYRQPSGPIPDTVLYLKGGSIRRSGSRKSAAFLFSRLYRTLGTRMRLQGQILPVVNIDIFLVYSTRNEEEDGIELIIADIPNQVKDIIDDGTAQTELEAVYLCCITVLQIRTIFWALINMIQIRPEKTDRIWIPLYFFSKKTRRGKNMRFK